MNMKFLMLATAAVAITACDQAKEYDKSAMKSEDKMVVMDEKEDQKMMTLSSKYTEYETSKMDQLKGNQKFVVFFHADWCPTCVKWEGITNENLDNLPENTVILKADYDTEQDLVKELRVKKQSSAVFFDARGEIVDVISDPSQEVISNFFSQDQEDVMAMADSKYMTFNQADFDAMKGQEKMIVFFHADWCGTCRKWENNLKENMGTLSSSAKIMKADFDTDTALAKSLGVNKQSTAVFFNADGSVAKEEMDPSIDSMNAFFNEGKIMEVVPADEEEVMMAKSAVYDDYTAEAGQGQKHVLFFHASWCPTCVKWDKSLKDNLEEVPENALILKADYDTMTDLAKQYEVTKHSTAVFVNADGSVAKKELDPGLDSVNAFFTE